MAHHKLKITPQYFYDVCYRGKRFELCKDNRDYKVGDTLWLEEFDNGKYTGKTMLRVVIIKIGGVLWDWYCSQFEEEGEKDKLDCEDAISRQAINSIQKLPSVQPARRKGQWLNKNIVADDYAYIKCSQCQRTQVLYYSKPYPKYCPECGAEMTD